MNDELSKQILSELKSINGRLDNLEQGQAKLEQGQIRLEEGQTKLEQRQTKLEEGQAKLEQRQTKLEQGQARLEQGQVEIRASLDNLTTYVEAIHHHQNEDYRLLQTVNEKVTNLANISEVHEERFQKLKTL